MKFFEKFQEKKAVIKGGQDLHRKAVGDMWEEIGKLQFEFLVKKGLLPRHKFLDIGCGSLRGGVHFIKYLDDGNYYGIDKNENLLSAGREMELQRYGLRDKRINLLQNEKFEFDLFNIRFDYALAQSVFTHLPWNSLVRCIVNIDKVLKKGGNFFATFFEHSKGKFNLDPETHEPGGIRTYFDQNPYHYDFEVFVDICKRTSLSVKYIGEWNHPRNQKMMVFRKGS